MSTEKSTDNSTDKSIEEKLNAFNGELPLERAHSIPSTWYCDADIHQRELDTVFGRHWQTACRRDQVEDVGQYVQTKIAGERIVVVRTESGLRAFYDVCRHKAASVVSAPCGRASRFRCRYHGWTYNLEGQLIGAPDFSEVKDFDRGRTRLPPVEVAVWGPLVFVSLSAPRFELDRYLSPLPDYASEMQLDDLRFHSSKVYELECNWKVFIDNYLDGGYHINTVHPDLALVLDYSGYTITNQGFTSLQFSPMSEKANSQQNLARPGNSAYYWWVYPNLMINVYEGILDTNLVVPLGVNRCRVIFDYYFSAEATHLAEKSIEVAHQVQLEDEGVCREVQAGLQSRSYETGRFSVKRESGAFFFHQLLARELRAS